VINKIQIKDLNLIGLSILTFISYIAGFFITLIDIDATQYAAISKEMVLNGSLLEIFYRGNDYLDKPPMLFWTSAISFKIFGINHFAYRLPSFLISLLGIYSVYRFCIIFYNKQIAMSAILITANCQAFYLMHHDVRTDCMLTGFVMFSFWQMAAYMSTKKWKHLVFFSFAVAFAMMTKGPIGLMIIIIAFGSQFIITRSWHYIFNWHYLIAIGIIALLLFPMSWGLYHQFDLHPEKFVYGLQGPSGLRFFYWTQSFGRITGESNWSNNPDTFFLVHSFLWSFLPWSLLFVPALVWALKIAFQNIRERIYTNEHISLCGFVFVFVFMSLSSYQLPHYTFVIHPLAAIILARYMFHLRDAKQNKMFLGIIIFTLLLLIAVAVYLSCYAFKQHFILCFCILLSTCIGLFFIIRAKNLIPFSKVLYAGAFGIACINLILNVSVYPQILKYQAYSEIAFDINKIDQNQSGSLIVFDKDYWCSLDFYLNRNILFSTNQGCFDSISKSDNTWILTDTSHFNQIKDLYHFKNKKIYYHFPVSNLSIDFINPETRPKTLSPFVLAKF
jgi:4-amino-4-deoxy-L-arabinose transferase-like glycosyltransferase